MISSLETDYLKIILGYQLVYLLIVYANRLYLNFFQQFQHIEARLKWSWSLQWRHNDHDGVSNHQPHGCLLNRLFRRRSKKTSKLRVTGLCVGNSPGTGKFPAQMASNAENVSIWWRHHVLKRTNAFWWSNINGAYTNCRDDLQGWFYVCAQPMGDGVTL